MLEDRKLSQTEAIQIALQALDYQKNEIHATACEFAAKAAKVHNDPIKSPDAVQLEEKTYNGVIEHCQIIIAECDKAYTVVEGMNDPDIKTIAPEVLAGEMYDIYCTSVGGKAFNGDLLPKWSDFRADDTKKKQSDAWLITALAAIEILKG